MNDTPAIESAAPTAAPAILHPLVMTERAVKLLAGVEQPSPPVAIALALMEQVREFLAVQQQGKK